MDLQPGRGPGSRQGGSRDQQSRDGVNLLGLISSFGEECLVNDRKEQNDAGVFFQPVLLVWFSYSSFFFFQFQKQTKKNS